MDPKLSVITSVHKADPKFLKELFVSLSAIRDSGETKYPFEWLIQADGDKALENQIRDCIPREAWIRVASHGAKLGPASSRNYAISRARGEFIRNVDADDILLRSFDPEIKAFDNKEVGLVLNPIKLLIKDKIYNVSEKAEFYSSRTYDKGFLDYAWRVKPSFGFACSPLTFRKDLGLKVGGYKCYGIIDDLEFILRLNYESKAFITDTPSILYRIHPEQTVANLDKKIIAHDRWMIHKSLEPLNQGRAPLPKPQPDYLKTIIPNEFWNTPL